jgi:predicted nucleic acid-binding protein
VKVFVDTSALLNLVDIAAAEHSTAHQVLQRIRANGSRLYTTNYVVLEATALIQNRFGMTAIKELHGNLITLLRIVWVDEELHRAGIEALLAASRRQLSLVDCVSFAACRLLAVDRVFAFDRHFEQQGFRLLV